MHGLPPNALVEKHLWIVDRFASTYSKVAPQTRADLKAAGALGLCEAAQRFKPRRGAAFSTYAWNWVKGHVLSELRRCHVVPVPEHTARAAKRSGEPVRGVMVFAVPDGAMAREDDADAEQEPMADRAMRHRALHYAIEALESPLHQHVINRTMAGRSLAQIAKGMRCTQPRVAELLEEAQGLLGELLED